MPDHGPPAAVAHGVRMVLLAREGVARDALRACLCATGVELVLEADPGRIDCGTLRDVAPEAVLVVLDAAVEAQLSRFDEVLLDDAVLVLFEDAESVAQRDEWENARWLRHVVAKLNRHGDVLPPRPLAPGRDLAVETVEACIGSRMPAAAEVPAAEANPPGAALVLAGMGGPDALRQLLSALPPTFGQPLLIRQRLYGGHYDHLLRQLARVSALPVQLAQAGETASPGRVYLLPEDTVASAEGGLLRFVQGVDDLAGLPASDSTVLLLSGCDAARAEAAEAWAQGGARLVAQSPETCFDDTAARALMAHGGDAATPAAMARRLCAQA